MIPQTAAHVRTVLCGDSSHDWRHIERVWANAKAICAKEPDADPIVVEVAALLHDIADWKFHNGDLSAGPSAARAWLTEIHAPTAMADRVVDIVSRVSFKGAGVPDEMPTLEGQIVQDADRLDAIGAIGIARAFAYGGHAGRPLYDHDELAVEHQTARAYMASTSSTVAHFHEKLLLLLSHESGSRPGAARRTYSSPIAEAPSCRWPRKAPHRRPSKFPAGGHGFSPWVALVSPHGLVLSAG